MPPAIISQRKDSLLWHSSSGESCVFLSLSCCTFSRKAVNDALQPGGGATSDDSSPYDDEETMFAHEQEVSREDLSAMGQLERETFASTARKITVSFVKWLCCT